MRAMTENDRLRIRIIARLRNLSDRDLDLVSTVAIELAARTRSKRTVRGPNGSQLF